MTATLYYNTISRPARLVQLVTLEANIPVEYKSIDLLAGENKTPEFLKINPFHQVPAYSDDKLNLYESGAILRYLLAIHKTSLFPQDDPVQIALVDREFEKTRETLIKAVDRFIYASLFSGMFGAPSSEQEIQAAKTALENSLKLLEENYFKTSDYLVGTTYTLADLNVANALLQLALSTFDISTFTKVQSLFNKISQLESFKTIKDEFDVLRAHLSKSA